MQETAENMRLPSIVKQVGIVRGETRVYIEDYVYAYLNRLKKERISLPVRVALYGHAFNDENKQFYLIYGASNIVEEMENGRSQEHIREKFFREYSLIGFVNIYDKKELPQAGDGCYVFYESNEAMQNYLISCYKRRDKSSVREKGITTARTGRPFVWVELLKKIGLSVMILISAVAVTTINSYEKLHEFMLLVVHAIQRMG